MQLLLKGHGHAQHAFHASAPECRGIARRRTAWSAHEWHADQSAHVAAAITAGSTDSLIYQCYSDNADAHLLAALQVHLCATWSLMYKRDFAVLLVAAIAVYFSLQNEGDLAFRRAWYVYMYLYTVAQAHSAAI